MIPQDISEKLTQLKHRIRKYVLAEGIAVVVVGLCLFFWLTFGADAIHFALRKLELPAWFRRAASLLAICSLAFLAMTWIAGRYFRTFGQRALALVLERRFPQLGDRLITAIDLVDSPQTASSPVSGVLYERTVSDAARSLRSIDLGTVFDPAPLRRMATLAGVLLASVIGFGVIDSGGFQRWFNAFVLGRAGYWEPYRQSLMTVHVVAQPGDRILQFDANQVYKHPRGSDLTLVATTPEAKVVPERVTLAYRAYGPSGATRGSVPMTRTGDREFRQSLSRVIESHDLWVSGGDFVNPTPFRIQIVDLPKIDRLDLICDYPSYTGMDSLEDQPVPVVGTQASLPMETRFFLQATLSKPIVRASIRAKQFELDVAAAAESGQPGSVTWTAETEGAPGKPISLKTSEPWISADGLQLRIPFHLSTKASEQFPALAEAGSVTHVPLPPDLPLQITFEDRDQVISPEPIPLTIAGIVDQDPVVDAKLTGVSSVVTRTASIPLTGRITDDYGVRKAEFGVKVGEAGEFTPAPITVPPRGEKEFTIKGKEDQKSERFNVLQLELQDGAKFALTMFGQDGDDLNGPHRVHGEVYSFSVVSPDELLARLNDKELNLRLRFEQIIEETNRIREDLAKHISKANERQELRGRSPQAQDAPMQLTQLDAELRGCAERLLLLERKNHTECRSIELAFRDIREEMINNRVDSATVLERIERNILEPLQSLNDADYPGLDGHLGVFRLQEERRQDPREEMDVSLQSIDAMLARMKQILDVMQRRETFAELIKNLQDLRDRQSKLLEETRKQQQREAFEKLGIPGM
jgi:hypothetical protein